MKPYCFFFFCLLTTSLYFSSPSITYALASSSSFTIPLAQARRTMRELSISTPNHEQRHNEVLGKEWQQSDIRPHGVGGDNEADEVGDELLYHIDYHGVSTHPNPTPKHPKP